MHDNHSKTGDSAVGSTCLLGKRRMQGNPKETGYHRWDHDEDPTCHKTHEGDTPCIPVPNDKVSSGDEHS